MPQHDAASSATTSPPVKGGEAPSAYTRSEAVSISEPPRSAPKEAPMPTAPKCLACHGDTKPYQGANPHKLGTYVCPACGVRVRPE